MTMISTKLVLFVATILLHQAETFVLTRSRSERSFRSTATEAEPDLFDYFDPLLSPHAYPNGISPDHKPDLHHEEQQRELRVETFSNDFATEPLPSQSTVEEESSANPSPLANLKFDHMSKPSFQKGAVVDPDYFDPLLSPHAYPNGTPDQVIGDVSVPKTKKVTGVLLMDHGSKNQASNDRLQELAQIYQQSVGGPIVVKAAHMEIASPSIPEGLQSLLDEGVGKSCFAIRSRW